MASQEGVYTPTIKGLSGVQKGCSFQVTNLFITWPRCDVDKQESGLLLRELLGPLFLVVAEEAHADGTPHLHAFVKLKRRTRVHHYDLDLIVGKHGNYQSARSVVNCIRYCAKDSDYYSFGINVQSYLETADGRHSSTATLVFLLIKNGSDLKEVYDMYPAYSMNNKSKIEEWIDYFEGESNMHIDRVPWIEAKNVLERDVVENVMDEIADWLTKNVRTPRILGQKHLYIWGATMMGKTTLYNKLKTYLNIYRMPSGKWHPKYRNGVFDMIVFDEFRGQQTVTFMNQICDGGDLYLESKGGGRTYNDFLPILVLANLLPGDIYVKVPTVILEAFERRFHFVNVNDFIDILD